MNKTLTPAQETLALSHNPFDGDETDVSNLGNKFVIGRKAHECFQCTEVIEPGERHRAMTERNHEERTIKTFRFCSACCETFATYEGPEGDDEPMLVRYEQGQVVYSARHEASHP